MTSTEKIKWRRAADGDGIEAEADELSAAVYRRASTSSDHPAWMWAAYRNKKRINGGAAYTQGGAKVHAESAMAAAVKAARKQEGAS